MTTCLVVDDDPELRSLVESHLVRFGFDSRHAGTARAMRAELARGGIDLVLLDLMLPDGNGIELCRELRTTSKLPVIMLTAQGDPISRVVGLEIGADDYLAKPFEPRELVARIQAVLRRTNGTLAPASPETLRFAGWEVDWRQRVLRRADGVALPLSNAEFRLFSAFAEHPGRVLSRARLVELTRAAGGGDEANERSIDLAVSRLRQKLGDPVEQPRFIRTVRGQGYRFVADPEEA
jgi:two-component system OmpR family response regulator